ncbi:MAG: squalene/phytoene synthase family protein [Rhodanobacteraceae bacterium]
MALRFMAPDQRNVQSAFACLARELEHAAYDVREATVAAGKLEWWAGELISAARGTPQHPLTRVLARIDAFAHAPWNALIAGAMSQRDVDASGDLSTLLAGHQLLQAPLAEVQAMMFAGVSATATAASRSISCALRELIRLDDGRMREGTLPLPLDLLARHQLTRAELMRSGSARNAAVCDMLSALVARFDVIAADVADLALTEVATMEANRVRARRALRARDPLVALRHAFRSVSPRVAWSVWRRARAS